MTHTAPTPDNDEPAFPPPPPMAFVPLPGTPAAARDGNATGTTATTRPTGPFRVPLSTRIGFWLVGQAGCFSVLWALGSWVVPIVMISAGVVQATHEPRGHEIWTTPALLMAGLWFGWLRARSAYRLFKHQMTPPYRAIVHQLRFAAAGVPSRLYIERGRRKATVRLETPACVESRLVPDTDFDVLKAEIDIRVSLGMALPATNTDEPEPNDGDTRTLF